MPTDKGHQARKRFGQNFLTSDTIIQQIVAAIRPQKHDHLVEIGPGQGALTQYLISHCPSMTMVELDRDLVPILETKFADVAEKKIIQQDALRFDFSALADRSHSLRVVGNLPYNISTPLIFKLLQDHRLISDMHFMLQKEVVDRIVAQPGHKQYGRLSVMTQYYCTAECLFTVPPESFAPAPKVNSAIVRLVPYTTLPNPANSIKSLELVVKTAFQQRRKTLRNALKNIIDDRLWQELPFQPSLRPENLTLADFVCLANKL